MKKKPTTFTLVDKFSGKQLGKNLTKDQVKSTILLDMVKKYTKKDLFKDLKFKTIVSMNFYFEQYYKITKE